MTTFIQKWKRAHNTRWPELNGTASIEAWRAAKAIEDKISDRVEKDMTEAFGCHGEPIANAISDTIHKLAELVPATLERSRREIVLKGFQEIGDHMTDVRSELDSLIDKMANEQRQEGFDERGNHTPNGCDLQASEYGVDLNTSLEDAFERGVDAVSDYANEAYCESVSVGMDDL